MNSDYRGQVPGKGLQKASVFATIQPRKPSQEPVLSHTLRRKTIRQHSIEVTTPSAGVFNLNFESSNRQMPRRNQSMLNATFNNTFSSKIQHMGAINENTKSKRNSQRPPSNLSIKVSPEANRRRKSMAVTRNNAGSKQRKDGNYQGRRKTEAIFEQTSDSCTTPLYFDEDDDMRLHSDSYVPPEILAKLQACKNKRCNTQGRAHQHLTKDCSEHPGCIAEQPTEQIPFFTTLPQPLPKQTENRDYNEFLTGVQNGKFGETGSLKKNQNAVVTQDSLDHYLAQQWNLDIDKFPASLPAQLETIKKMWHHYSWQAGESATVQGSSKQTLAKKMKEWMKGTEARKLMELEIMYLKSNQNPKLYDLIMDQVETHDQSESAAKKAAAAKKKKKKAPLIGKSTPIEYFRLPDTKDMIPTIYPDTMQVRPLYLKLKQEHLEKQKLREKHPQANQSELIEHYNREIKDKELVEYKKKLNMVPKLRPAEKEHSFKPNYHSRKRMESPHLNTFMNITEIQEIAERHAQFQKYVKRQRANSGLRNSQTSRTSQPIAQDEVSQLATTIKTAKSRQQGKVQSNQQTQPFQSITTEKANISTNSRSAVQSNGMNKSESERGTSLNTMATSANMKQTLTTKPGNKRARLFSSMKTSIIGYEHKRPATQMLGSDNLLVGGASQDFEDDLYAPSKQSLIPSSPGIKNLQTFGVQSDAPTFRTFGGLDSAPSQLKEKSRNNKRKFFTITVQPRDRGTSVTEKAQSCRPQRLSVHEARSRDYGSEYQNFLKQEPDMQKQTLTSVVEQQRRPSTVVQADVIESHQSGITHLKRQLRMAKWQSDKDGIVDSMSYHMTNHRPKIRLTEQQSTKRGELASMQKQGNSLLQQQLSCKFQVKGTEPVRLSDHKETFLSEVPILMAEKEKADEMMRTEAEQKKDACRVAVIAEQKTIADTVVTGQINMNASVNLSKTSSLRNSLPDKPRISFSDKKSPLRMSQSPDLPVTNAMQGSTLAAEAEDQSSVITGTVNLTNIAKKSIEVAPQDPKPDVIGIAKGRFENFKNNFVTRAIQRQKKHKKQQTKLEDPWSEDGSAQSQRGSIRSQSQQKSHEQTAHKPLRESQNSNVTKQTLRQSRSINQMESKYKLEPLSPGMGTRLEGSELKKVTASILANFEDEIEEKPFEVGCDMELNMPELEWPTLKLYSMIKDMDDVEFWQQKGLQCAKKGQIDAAMDYYRQGLRKNPTNETLIYSLALCFMKLKKYRSAILWFGKGVDLNPRWVDGLCGIAITYFNMLDFDRALRYMTMAKDNMKGEQQTLANFDYSIISFIHSSCLKMTGNLAEACRRYNYLEVELQRNMSRDLSTLVWGLILIPLSDDRKRIGDHFHYLREYCLHIKDAKTPQMDRENLLLSKYCIGRSKDQYGTGSLTHQAYSKKQQRLNFDTYSQTLWTLINRKSFFKRFNNLPKGSDKQDLYSNILKRAKVKLYAKGQVVFPQSSVGIVMMGSVEIRKHNNRDLLKPFVVKKAIEGDIIGWAEGDRADSSSPLSWIVVMQDNTEVIFIGKDDWEKLWGLQKSFTEQQIVLQKLEQNLYFRQLNLITKYHFVFETIELKNFFPGQLILSVHQRSPICAEFHDFYKDGTSKFRREIDNKVMKQALNQQLSKTSRGDAKPETIYTAYLGQLNKGEESSQLGEMRSKIMSTSRDRTPIPSKRNSKRTSRRKTSRAGVSEEDVSEFQGDGAKQIKFNIGKDCGSEFTDTSSDSTDYGERHAEQMIKEKEDLMKVKIGKATEAINSVMNEKLKIFGVKFAIDEKKESDKPIQDTPSVKFKLFNDEITSASAKADETRSVSLTKTPGLKSLNFANEVNNMQLSKKTQSPDGGAAPFDKRRKFSDQKSKVNTAYIHEMSAHRQFKKFEHIIPEKLDSGMVDIKDVMFEQAKIHGVVPIEHERTTPSAFSASYTVNKKNQENKDKTIDHVNYKFLVEKQFQKIQTKDRQTRQDHKGRKTMMNDLLKSASVLEKELQPAKNNKKKMKKMLTEHMLKSQADVMKSFDEQNLNEKSQHVSSGFNNQILMKKVESKLQMLAVLAPNAQEMIYQAVVQTLQIKEHQQGTRIEPDGVHFIDGGEVLVVGANCVPNVRLNKCDSFGFCDILRKTGAEFLGDVRAGIRKVQTFYIPYDEFKNRISIPEKIRLLTQDKSEQMRLEGVINLIQHRDKVSGEKLRRY